MISAYPYDPNLYGQQYPLVPSGGVPPLMASNASGVMSSVPQTSTWNAIKSGTLENVMNPGIGNVAMAALPMLTGGFTPESIGQGLGGYLGSAAGGAAAGALSGTSAGAAMGSALGPIGTVVGGALGSLGGGEIGKLFGGDKAEKEKKKQKKRQQFQWLGDAVKQFSNEFSRQSLSRRSAIDNINAYLQQTNAARSQMRPF